MHYESQVLLLHDYLLMRNCFLQISHHNLKHKNSSKSLKCLSNVAFDIPVPVPVSSFILTCFDIPVPVSSFILTCFANITTQV